MQVHGGLRTAPAGPVWRALPGGEYYQRQLPSCRGVMGRGTGPATVRRHLGSHAGPAQFPGPWALQRLSAEQHVPAAVLLGLRLSGLARGVVGDSAFFGMATCTSSARGHSSGSGASFSMARLLCSCFCGWAGWRELEGASRRPTCMAGLGLRAGAMGELVLLAGCVDAGPPAGAGGCEVAAGSTTRAQRTVAAAGQSLVLH